MISRNTLPYNKIWAMHGTDGPDAAQNTCPFFAQAKFTAYFLPNLAIG